MKAAMFRERRHDYESPYIFNDFLLWIQNKIIYYTGNKV